MWMLGGAVIVVVAWAVALSLIDVRVRRLPNHLTVPAACGAVIGAVGTDPLLLLGGVAWAGLYMLTGGFGGGDVKLAVSLGILAASGGEVVWFGAVIGASVITVIQGLVSSQRTLPHGPAMIVATFASLAVAASIAAVNGP
ncbi:prepilin peptidase [Corynebacterium testudinoris]|uniref:Type IV leader peptidase n=1 Tax=Corynebacterium testudinoris TaxID=136857 RepID=A0A0G3HCK0_9CORY|nr:A24 family peptidase [Corynebacterium testudinoris]AKK08897.1 type IV leader peptidase [Corynebacterium testudinoris]MBX8994952.1 prepilin peptidase [Corynebacterium testudinoris]